VLNQNFVTVSYLLQESAKQYRLSTYPFTGTQRKAVELLLSKAKGWRIALPSDNRSPDLEQYQNEHPGYTPYFVEGDLTGDGSKDFAIAVIKGEYYGVVFFKAEGDNYLPPQWLTRKGALDDGGLFIDDRGLWGGQFYTDNLFHFVWSVKEKRLVPK
jgi:hypothetical protein